MRYVNTTILSASDDVSRNSSKVDANNLIAASFHIIFSAVTFGGTVKVQASNDEYDTQYLPSQFTPTNWVDIPNQSATIIAGSATSAILTIPQMSYRWVRVVVTQTTPGTGTVTVKMMALGM